MAKYLLFLLTAALHAAVIRGVVVENQSGKPLARALVVLQPVAGTAGPGLSTRTNTSGAFEFPPVSGGTYLVSASRAGFAPAQYGQKQFKSSGTPVTLGDADVTALDFRLKRFGAITGTIEDENEVGLPDLEVAAYRNTRPPKIASKAKADDRGVYRIPGLEPGVYLVRTLPKIHEDGGYLPTFCRETQSVDQAQTVEVALDEDTGHVNVKPAPGRLLTLEGRVYVSPPRPVTLTLVSEMGRETRIVTDTFEFQALAPGPYELIAQTADNWAAYQPISLERDQSGVGISLSRMGPVRFQFLDSKGGQPVDPATVQLLARHKDLAGEEAARPLKLVNGMAPLGPGRWELAVVPSPAWYVSAFEGYSGSQTVSTRVRPDGWNDFVAHGYGGQGRFTLSASPGSVHGTVKGAGGDPVGGVPVFLEPRDPELQRPMEIRGTRTDTRGQYQFPGLAPGEYRLLATFEYRSPDAAILDAAGARTVKVEEGRDVPQDLDLYVIR